MWTYIPSDLLIAMKRETAYNEGWESREKFEAAMKTIDTEHIECRNPSVSISN
jgi:hypothetical protein